MGNKVSIDRSHSNQTWGQVLLGSLGQVTTSYARTVVTVVLTLSILAVFYTARHLEFLTSRNDLISPNKRYLQLDEMYADVFHGLGQLVVVAEGPDLRETTTFIRRLGERLAADPEQVAEVFYRVDTSSLDGKKLLLLSSADLRTLRKNLEDAQDLVRNLATNPGLNTLLAAINQKISTAMVLHLTRGFLGVEEPEGNEEEETSSSLAFYKSLLEQMDQALSAPGFSYHSPWADLLNAQAFDNDGFLVSDDQRFVFLLVEPRTQGEGLNAYQESISAIRRHIAELKPEFPRVQAGVTGEKALGNDEILTAQTDSSLATVISLVGVGLLYLLFFRSIQRTILVVVTMIVGLAWTLGVLTLTVGHLTIISIFVASILIGLADDRIVYFLSRYEEERNQGRSFQEAIQRTFAYAAPGVVVAACTNALAFYAMMLTDFRGIQELGFITGNGILLSGFVTLTFLPALLTVTEGQRPWPRFLHREGRLRRGFAWWEWTLQRFRRPVLLLTVGTAVLGLFALPTLSFDYNLLHLQARGTESVIWEQQMVEQAGRSSWFALAAAPSLAEAAQEAAQFEALPSVEKVETVTSLMPEEQGERMRLIRALQPIFAGLPATPATPGAVNVEALEHTLKRIQLKLQDNNEFRESQQKPAERETADVRRLLAAVLARLEILPATDVATALEYLQDTLFQDFAEKWALLRDNLHPSGPIGLADIPPQLRKRFVSADGKLFLLQIYPHTDIWERGPLMEFVDQLRQVDPNVTGSPVIGYESIQAIKDGYVRGGLYAAAAVLVATFLAVRKVKDTLIALLPVACGMLWTAGLMWLCNLKFNLANLVAVPITISIGIESGIYLVRRAREEVRESRRVVKGSTGQAVTLFSLSTMIGFGSLMLARHYGIFSMGLLLTLAVGSVLLASFTVLPLLLQPSSR